MTFAEILLLLAAGFLIYRGLRPLQRRLERTFHKWLSRGSAKRPIIDITEYSNKFKNKKEGQ